MSKNVRNLLIHVGYAKAGSTWVQECFSDTKSGFLNFEQDAYSLSLDDFVQANSLFFDEAPYVECFKLHAKKAADLNCTPVLSSERFVGNWFSGGYDVKQLAKRLHLSAPDAKILIIFREQVQMLTSIYRQYVKKGGGRSLEKFLFPPTRGRTRIPEFSFNYFEYDKIINCYQNIFGSKNVMALPLEFIAEAPEDAFKLIQDFSAAIQANEFTVSPQKKNVGISAIEASIKRHLNIFLCADALNDFSTLHNPVTKSAANIIYKGIAAIIPVRTKKKSNEELTEKIKIYVQDRYCESNRKTSEIIKMDLSKYGYMS